jgi:leucyl aminopeptidase (aminopeptidase T)
MTVKKGNITKIEGGPEAKWVDKSMKKALASGDQNANHWAEFLIGLNPNALINCYGGSLLEDERQLGALSIGWGRDAHLGGTFPAKFHGDGMVRDVTIILDGITIMEDGRLKLR